MKVKEHRCPWCGEQIKAMSTHNIFLGKCIYCGGKYKMSINNIFYIISLVLILVANFFLARFEYGVLTIFIIHSLLIILVPFKRDFDKFITLKGIKIHILYNSKKEKKKYRLLLTSDKIVTICFVDKENKPQSNMICVTVDSVIWNEEYCECNLYFLPKGQQDTSRVNNDKINIFYNNTFLCRGTMIKYIDNLSND